jgi:hypothetical protein
MILKLSLIGGVAAMAIALAAQSVSAVPLSNNALGTAASEGALVNNVQWHYCHRVREGCAAKWGWRSWRYFRCVGRRGCA